MVQDTIFQHWIVTQFILPFALIFFILFGILEKTQVFGEGKRSLNAMIAFVVGLIFVGAIFPKLVVSNLTLFLTVAIVVVFIALILWGFIIGETPKVSGKLKWLVLLVVIIAMVIATLWAMGVEVTFFDFLFKRTWSTGVWTNVAFVIVVIVAIAVAIGTTKSK